MSLRSIYCIATSRGRADCIVVNLKEAGFSSTEVSILFMDPAGILERTGLEEAAPAQPSAGAIRGIITWIGGIQRIETVTSGPVIAGGAIVACMTAVDVSGVIGGLIRFGMPLRESGRYADRVMASQIFLCVQTQNSEAGDRAREIFAAGLADDIFTKIDIHAPRYPAGKDQPGQQLIRRVGHPFDPSLYSLGGHAVGPGQTPLGTPSTDPA